MKDEKDEIKELERRTKELKAALEEARLRNVVLESLVEAAGEHYNIDIKKTFGKKVPKKR